MSGSHLVVSDLTGLTKPEQNCRGFRRGLPSIVAHYPSIHQIIVLLINPTIIIQYPEMNAGLNALLIKWMLTRTFASAPGTDAHNFVIYSENKCVFVYILSYHTAGWWPGECFKHQQFLSIGRHITVKKRLNCDNVIRESGSSKYAYRTDAEMPYWLKLGRKGEGAYRESRRNDAK